MREKVCVRPATPDDIEAMGGIIAGSWKDAYRGIVEDGYLDDLHGGMWEGFFREGLNDGTLTCLLLEQSGDAAGVAVMCPSRMDAYPNDAELVSLYLLPGLKGKGLGKKLLSYAMDEMRRQGFTHCVLDVLCGNARATAFYGKNGFTKTGEQIETTLGNQTLLCDIMRAKL